jgi:hypothetical protein
MNGRDARRWLSTLMLITYLEAHLSVNLIRDTLASGCSGHGSELFDMPGDDYPSGSTRAYLQREAHSIHED